MQTFKPVEVKKLIDPYLDLGNLLFLDKDPLSNESSSKSLSEDTLLELARDNAQFLFNEIWKLPRKNVDQFICAELPNPTYTLPREKPMPKPREPTKWEKFAKAKGIVKKPKDRKVFDKTTEEWKPRYGYRRASNDEANKDWLIEIPRQKDPYKDYFEERKQKKNEVKDKYEYQHMKNVARAMKAAGGGGRGSGGSNYTPLGPHKNNTSSGGGKEDAVEKPRAQFKRETQDLTNQMHRAKTATASVGKFQNAIKGEKKPKLGERRKFEANEIDTKSERQHQLDLLTKLQSKKPKLAASRMNAAHQASKAHNDDEGDGDNKRANKKAGANARKRRSAAGNWSKASKSNRNRQKHFNMVKKGGSKITKSKTGKAQSKKGRK